MTTKSFTLAKLIGDDNKISQDKFAENIVLGPEQYTTPDDLPLSGNQIGDQAFVGSTNRLYIWSGSGWYSVALINTNPSFDSGGSPDVSYLLDSIGGTATTITLLATDPEGIPITYSAIPSDSTNDFATITQTDNVFVVTARSLDSILANGYDSSGGKFSVTFRASDGVNLATALSEFTINFSIESPNLNTMFDASTNQTLSSSYTVSGSDILIEDNEGITWTLWGNYGDAVTRWGGNLSATAADLTDFPSSNSPSSPPYTNLLPAGSIRIDANNKHGNAGAGNGSTTFFHDDQNRSILSSVKAYIQANPPAGMPLTSIAYGGALVFKPPVGSKEVWLTTGNLHSNSATYIAVVEESTGEVVASFGQGQTLSVSTAGSVINPAGANTTIVSITDTQFVVYGELAGTVPMIYYALYR